MLAHNTQIWHFESPLDEEQELQESIHLLEEDPRIAFPLSSLQQRMYVILGVATLLVLIFAIFVIPFILRSISATISAAEPLANSVNRFQSDSAPLVVSGSDAISPIFSPEVQYWAPQIEKWASAQNLDPNMVATVMQIESCGDPNALSPAGAQGLFQVMPYHFAANENAMHPDTNALRGIGYLAERLVQTNGDTGKAFAGYNGGHVAAGSDYNSWANETQRYFRWSTTIYADAQAGLTHSPALDEWLNAGGASLCNQASNSLNLR